MLYTPLTKKAMRICIAAHEGQVDRTGMLYLLHPFIVADHVDGEFETCAALLHDVVEDTDWDFDDLEREGIPAEVIDALRLLTHADDMPYMDYVAAAKANPIARAVKLADLAHNMDLGRLDTVTDVDQRRVEKYRAARELLLSEGRC